MKERPIMFKGEMVRAILDGSKTQTRRVVKPHPGRQSRWLTSRLLASSPMARISRYNEDDAYGELGAQFDHPCGCPIGWVKCPFGQTGDRLWVRETWAKHDDAVVVYRNPPNWSPLDVTPVDKWIPSIFMPRWASRITLEVISVRVERLNDISANDAKSEGCVHHPVTASILGNVYSRHNGQPTIGTFHHLWDSINAKRAPWSSNPWVWVVEFKLVKS